MRKFGIEITKGNTETVIGTFNDKESAMKYGKDYFSKLPKGEGIVTCFEAEFDNNDQRIGTSEIIYHVWH